MEEGEWEGSVWRLQWSTNSRVESKRRGGWLERPKLGWENPDILALYLHVLTMHVYELESN
jgi:hypothetical protein